MALCLDEDCKNLAEFICIEHGGGICGVHKDANQGSSYKKIKDFTDPEIRALILEKEKVGLKNISMVFSESIGEVDKRANELILLKKRLEETYESLKQEFLSDVRMAYNDIHSYMKLQYWKLNESIIDVKIDVKFPKPESFLRQKQLQEKEYFSNTITDTNVMAQTLSILLDQKFMVNTPHLPIQAKSQISSIPVGRSHQDPLKSQSEIPESARNNSSQAINEISNFTFISQNILENCLTIEKWTLKTYGFQSCVKVFKSTQPDVLSKYFNLEIELYNQFSILKAFVQILSCIINQESGLIYTEFYTTTLLDEITLKKKFTEQEIISIMKNVLDCIKAIRKLQAKIVYLEPSWFVYCENKYKMADFVLEYNFKTQKYLAPELIQVGGAKYTPSSAMIFSLGLIVMQLYQVDIENLNLKLMSHLMSGLVESIPASNKLKNLLISMLSFDKNARISLKDLENSLN